MNMITPQTQLQRDLFNASRNREVSADLLTQLLTEASAYGVTQEFVDRSLSRVSNRDLSAALRSLDVDSLERIASASYLHPNGFYKLQLLVCDDVKVRLHYWPASTRSAEENLHNHRWRLASKIMLGELHSEIYREAHPDEAGVETLELRLYRKSRGAHAAEGIKRGQCAVKRSALITRCAGEAYALDTDTLHRIVQRGGEATLTLMVQSAPLFQENHMLSLPQVMSPDLSPQRLSGVDQLVALISEITTLLDAE